MVLTWWGSANVSLLDVIAFMVLGTILPFGFFNGDEICKQYPVVVPCAFIGPRKHYLFFIVGWTDR